MISTHVVVVIIICRAIGILITNCRTREIGIWGQLEGVRVEIDTIPVVEVNSFVSFAVPLLRGGLRSRIPPLLHLCVELLLGKVRLRTVSMLLLKVALLRLHVLTTILDSLWSRFSFSSPFRGGRSMSARCSFP